MKIVSKRRPKGR